MANIENEKYITTKYRFVVLGIFSLMGIITQIMWITFAPITQDIAIFYGVSENTVVWALTGSFMIAYLPVNFPACWLIDKFGLKWGVGIGVMITGIFGLILNTLPFAIWCFSIPKCGEPCNCYLISPGFLTIFCLISTKIRSAH